MAYFLFTFFFTGSVRRRVAEGLARMRFAGSEMPDKCWNTFTTAEIKVLHERKR